MTFIQILIYIEVLLLTSSEPNVCYIYLFDSNALKSRKYYIVEYITTILQYIIFYTYYYKFANNLKPQLITYR